MASTRRQTMLQTWDKNELDHNEELDQKITFTLQQIDANFSQCTDVASKILHQIRDFIEHTSTTEKNLQTWGQFFNKFYSQPSQDINNETHISSFVDTPRSLTNSINTPPTPFLGSPPRTTPYKRRPSPLEKDEQQSSIQFTPQSSQLSITPIHDWPRLRLSRTPVAPLSQSFSNISSLSRPNFIEDEEPQIEKKAKYSITPAQCHDAATLIERRISQFPSVYQEGIASMQLTEVYSQFFGSSSNIDDTQTTSDSGIPGDTLNMEQLKLLLPSFGEELILLMLDVLVSKKMIRQFEIAGDIFWQRVTSDIIDLSKSDSI